MTTPPQNPRTFNIPEILKRPGIGVQEISLTERILMFKFRVSDEMKGEIKVVITGNWENDANQLKNKTRKKGFTDNNIEQFVNGFSLLYSGEAADVFAEIKHGVDKIRESERIADAVDAEDEKKPKIIKYYLQKYHSPGEGNELYEAVLIGKDAYFVSLDRDSEEKEIPKARYTSSFTFPNAIGNTVIEILPRENMTYLSKPYRFESHKEVDKYLFKASKMTLDDIYRDVKKIVVKYIAASDTHHTILAADVVFTYFQDVFGQTHYLFFYGDNGSGKTINLQLLAQIAYRVMFDIDVTAANIYTYYGTVEEGQGCICEDEADDLDYHQEEKMKLYKKGYNAGGKVSRTDTGGGDSGGGRKQEGYYVYGFKAFTGEERLDPDYAKGFNERTFYLECQAGDPEYDLSEVVSPAGADEFEYLLGELEDTYKTLLAFRLLHHADKFPNIELAVKNREKQLTKPLIRLFQNSQCLDEISKALGELLTARRGVRSNTLEHAIYTVLDGICEENRKSFAMIAPGKGLEAFEFSAKGLYDRVRLQLDGTYKDEYKDQSFDTPEHGKISHKKISSICIDRFGAIKKHTRDGNFLVFDVKRLEKVKEAYTFDENGVRILKVKDMKDMKGSSSSEPSSTNFQPEDSYENQREIEESVEEFEENEEEEEETEDEEER